jgi:multiple sugar transport system ATP-binding protein
MHERLGHDLYVTHDQIGGHDPGQEVAVMREGTIRQCDTPRALFDQPRNVFVATFVGSPPMNLLKAHRTAEEFASQASIGKTAASGYKAE